MPTEIVPQWAKVPRDIVLVEGRDAGGFLHSQLAQDIGSLEVGGARHSLLLEPTGHVTALVRVSRRADERWTIDVERSLGQAVIDRLARFVLRAEVSMRLTDWECRAFIGDASSSVAPDLPGRSVAWWGDDSRVVEVVAPVEEMPDVAGLVELDEAAHDRIRVDARWPRQDVDFTAGDVPASIGVVSSAISFTKGCYPGQELVERMDSRGTAAPWELRWLPVEGRSVGDTIEDGNEGTALVTSVGNRRLIARVRRGSALGRALSDG